jgi:hypothetical protein
MLIAVVYLVVGLAEFDFVIFAGDIGFIAVVVALAQETRKIMKHKESKELLRNESPINWLKFSIEFFVFSLLSSLVYGFTAVETLSNQYAILIDYAVVITVMFFLGGLIWTVRIIWFNIDPASKGNIRAGKLMKTTAFVIVRAIFAFGILFLESINGLVFYFLFPLIYTSLTLPLVVYLSALGASFVATVPMTYMFMFRLNEKLRVRDYVASFFYFSPWIVLMAISLLIRMGITIQF